MLMFLICLTYAATSYGENEQTIEKMNQGAQTATVAILQGTIMNNVVLPSNARPRAFWRAESQLKLLLQQNGSGGLFDIQDELAICWAGLKRDPTVTDPERKMMELGEWFVVEFQAAILREIAANPIDINP